MKTLLKILFIVLPLMFLFSCQKDFDKKTGKTDNRTINSMNDLQVPSDFDWKTVKTIDVTVDLPDDGGLQMLVISATDGSKVYFRGYPDDGTRTLKTRITIPTAVNMVKLLYGDGSQFSPVSVGVDLTSLVYSFNQNLKSTRDVCGPCNGQVNHLELQYVGTEANPVVKVTQKKGSNHNFVIYNNNVVQNGTFDFDGANNPGNRMGAQIKIYVDNVLNTTIHTSCSQTILAGMQFGDFLIVSGTSTNGGPLCPVSGNTPPNATFTVTPGSGTTSTNFAFDASGVTDNENPTSVLEVRWDFDGDGVWDTPWTTTKTANHQYGSTGTYAAKLQVRDTGGLTDMTTVSITVNPGGGNTPPNAVFNVTPATGTTSTNFTFDASGVTDNEDATSLLEVRWDFDGDGTWDTPWSTTKTTNHQYASIGTYNVRMEVRDTGGLTDITTNQVIVNSPGGNTPPNAVFTVSPASGTVSTNFAFDASGVTDNEDVTSVLEVRWDFDGDGTWDTPWSPTKTANHTYSAQGTYTVRMEVRDSGGLTDVATHNVTVVPGGSTTVNYTGTLAYEDLWPSKGDYDFNDLVISYDFLILKNMSEQVQHITATFTIYAFGAGFYNGFGFTLPNVDPAQITAVTGYELKSNSIHAIAANGLEAGQSKATVIVYDDSFDQMTHPGMGIGVNTTPWAPYVTPKTLTVEMDFDLSNPITFSQLDIGNFNPFIIVNQNRNVEVHLPDYIPSDLADQSMLGTFEDASDPGTGKYYVTSTNLPWAINIPIVFQYPIEKTDITQVYYHFAEWAESGGQQYQDWYEDHPGYRNNSLIYTHQ